MKESKKKAIENPKYDKRNINELEHLVVEMRDVSRGAQKEMYLILDYLRITGRFKENEKYKKASFEVYLEDRFTIRIGTFFENKRAFTYYPEQAIEYGVGVVSKIERICGRHNIKTVLTEIESAAKKRKTELPRDNIEAIIQKHKKPVAEKEVINWKARYEAERLAHERTRDALKDATKTIQKLNERIEKLKELAEMAHKIKGIFKIPERQTPAIPAA